MGFGERTGHKGRESKGMFEPAVQSPAESSTAARINAVATDGIEHRGGEAACLRRYTAEDFRALTARLSTRSPARVRRRRPAAMPLTLPEALDWLQPDTLQVVMEPLPAEQEIVSDDIAEAAGHDEQVALVSEGVDEEPAEADPKPVPETLPAAAGTDETVEEIETAAATEISDAASVLVDEPRAEHAPALEAAGDDTEAAEIVAEPPEPDASDTAIDPDLQSAETARTLLDIMAMPTGVQPQERALAGDTLLRLVSRMPVASLIGLCDRLCIMDAPPPLLVRRLIQHENIEVAGPLLERCPGISDQDLMTMINSGNSGTLRLIARRRNLSPALTDALIRQGDPAVTIAVVRNPGAALSHEAFHALAETAKSRTSLQAPLATRADTPAPIAFELFWTLPPQLRRYVLSRFLTESANLDRILKIAQTLDESSGGAGNGSPPRIADKTDCEELVGLIAQGKTEEAALKLSALAGISGANAQRIIADSEGEPLTVAMKAIGMSRTQSAAAAETLRDAPAAPLRSNRRIAELQNLFDSLSFTKARVLLTYWDWAVEKSGPYSAKTV